jgi:hypothetical protein
MHHKVASFPLVGNSKRLKLEAALRKRLKDLLRVSLNFEGSLA